MTFNDFLYPRETILGYVKDGYLRHTLDLPNNAAIAEQLFMCHQQPKACKEKHGELHEHADQNPQVLEEFFECQHTQDVVNRTYKKIIDNREAAQ
jgi:hypothetical protein